MEDGRRQAVWRSRSSATSRSKGLFRRTIKIPKVWSSCSCSMLRRFPRDRDKKLDCAATIFCFVRSDRETREFSITFNGRESSPVCKTKPGSPGGRESLGAAENVSLIPENRGRGRPRHIVKRASSPVALAVVQYVRHGCEGPHLQR
jgi:hypothetical protein